MYLLRSRHAWLAAPILWFTGMLVLFAVWFLHTPDWIRARFDNDGASPVESATIGFFFLQIALLWLLPPVRKGRCRGLWLADFSLLSLFAVCRELDWHKALITASDLPGATHGTPFKMRFLTNPANPLQDRLIVAICFVVVIALCGGTLLYFLRRLLTGLFKLHPVCWSMGFFGGAILLIQVFDRANSVLRKDYGILLTDSQRALATVFEEGQELLLPLLVMLAIIQAYLIYVRPAEEDGALARFRDF